MALHDTDNVDYWIEDDGFLYVRVDLKRHYGPSNTGRSIIIASTRGQVGLGLSPKAPHWGSYMAFTVWRSAKKVRQTKFNLRPAVANKIHREVAKRKRFAQPKGKEATRAGRARVVPKTRTRLAKAVRDLQGYDYSVEDIAVMLRVAPQQVQEVLDQVDKK